MQGLTGNLKKTCQKLFDIDIEPELTRPEPQFGDYSTNIAMHLAGKLNKNPRDIAKAIKENFHHESVSKIEIADPGFINFTLTDSALICAINGVNSLPKDLSGQEIIVEFGDPNPFKEMHIGHLYTSIVGNAIAGLFEQSGAGVHRASYHGDVGLHVAKWLWAYHQRFGWDDKGLADLNLLPDTGIGHYYALGAAAYEKDEKTKAEIQDINDKVYSKADLSINKIYELGKTLSFQKFDEIFKLLGINYQRRYLESQSAEKGREYVRQNIGKVFAESDGAVVYKGERVGLHTRVFLTKQGLPTYEAKDLGLAELKNSDYPEVDRSIIITANEQTEYFKVMLAALHEIDAGLAEKTTHLAHGFLSLSSGKMSSRSGNIYSATNLLASVKDEAKKQHPDSQNVQETYLAAVKYGFLKHRLGSDIVYDLAESISLEGNSGPYLQYAHARARSILKKSSIQPLEQIPNFEQPERLLARKISEYPEVVTKATAELMPHNVCTYLYELAQVFNGFYEKCRVVGDPRESIRLSLVSAYAQVLKNGLELLNIAAPEHI